MMNVNLIAQLVKVLRDAANKIEAGSCEVDEEQAIKIMQLVAHQPMSKEKAAMYLNISTSKFDTLIREKKMPKGRKKLGWKEKRWYQDEIDECVNKIVEEQSNKYKSK